MSARYKHSDCIIIIWGKGQWCQGNKIEKEKLKWIYYNDSQKGLKRNDLKMFMF